MRRSRVMTVAAAMPDLLRAAVLALAMTATASVTTALAQTRAPAARSAPAPAPAPLPEPPPPLYEPDLLNLSEVIGSLAFLRTLCGAPDSTEWPERMSRIMAAEGTTDARRARLAGAYNRGLANFARTYRRCTPAAREAQTRLGREGDVLTRRLLSRFGG